MSASTRAAEENVSSGESERKELQRRRNRMTMAWLVPVLLALAAAGYAFGHWLLRHPPTSVHP